MNNKQDQSGVNPLHTLLTKERGHEPVFNQWANERKGPHGRVKSQHAGRGYLMEAKDINRSVNKGDAIATNGREKRKTSLRERRRARRNVLWNSSAPGQMTPEKLAQGGTAL